MLKIASHCFEGIAGRDKPSRLRNNLDPKVAAGFIPANIATARQAISVDVMGSQ
jgi:hypothetical protein